MLIEGAKYYTIETPNDHFSIKICGQNYRTIRDLRSPDIKRSSLSILLPLI